MDYQVKRQFKDALFEQFARIGGALANGHRIELLDVLAQAERSVEELAAETALTVANASQHLQVLRRAGLVETRREGTRVCYRLAGSEVFALWQALRPRAREEFVAFMTSDLPPQPVEFERIRRVNRGLEVAVRP